MFSLAACASSTPNRPTPTLSDTTDSSDTAETSAITSDTAETDGETETAPAGDYKVAMICDSSISDGGWGMSCYNAMVDAAAKYGWATEVLRQHRSVRLL